MTSPELQSVTPICFLILNIVAMLLKFYKENKPPKKTKKRTRRQSPTRINSSVFVPRVEPLQLMLRET